MRSILLIVILSAVTVERSESLQVLGIFPGLGKSHFVIGEELMKHLAQKGHSVDVLSYFPQPKPISNYTDLNLWESSAEEPYAMPFPQVRGFSPVSLKLFVDSVGNELCDELEKQVIKDLLMKPRDSYDIVVVELFASPCFLGFGRHFNVPMVAVVASKPFDWLYSRFSNPVNTAYMTSIFSGSSQYMTFYERVKNTFLLNWIAWQFDYYSRPQFEQVEKSFGAKFSSVQDLYDDVSIVLVNTHPSIYDVMPAVPKFIDIGGLHVDPDQTLSEEIKDWLDKSEHGCVYISFGSMVPIETMPADKLAAFYEMFRRISPTRVLMRVLKPETLPGNLPDNVKTSKWLPQVAVLQHENVKAFVTHGGLLGTQEALAWAVPMVGIPLFGDQYSNIRTYVDKKIAVSLDVDSLDSESLTIAVKDVLNNPDYQKNIKMASKLFMDRPMTAKDSAVYWIEYAARHGNRLESPAAKLSWCQYHLLDVGGLFLFSIFLVLYIIKRIVGFIIRRFKWCRERQDNNSRATE